MSRFFSDKYKSLVPYVPGEQPTDMKYVKLNTNESPFPLSEKALKAAEEALQRLELYPDPECRELKNCLPKFMASRLARSYSETVPMKS